MLTAEHLKLSSVERLIELSKYRNARWMFITDELSAANYGLPINAELIDIENVKGNTGYNGRAVFRIDKQPGDVVPLGGVLSTEKYFHRGVYLRRTTASELVKDYGRGGTVVIHVPAATTLTTTHDLVPLLMDQLDIPFSTTDIVKEVIPATNECIMIRFQKTSLAYIGAFRLLLVKETV